MLKIRNETARMNLSRNRNGYRSIFSVSLRCRSSSRAAASVVMLHVDPQQAPKAAAVSKKSPEEKLIAQIIAENSIDKCVASWLPYQETLQFELTSILVSCHPQQFSLTSSFSALCSTRPLKCALAFLRHGRQVPPLTSHHQAANRSPCPIPLPVPPSVLHASARARRHAF